jgi:uncharacterized protein YqhQ
LSNNTNKSQAARAFAEDGALKTHVGGQALLEGIMMRGKFNWAVAVREPEGGIYVEEHDLASGKREWMRKPFVRGCVALVDSLALSFKAMQIAADHAFPEDIEEEAAKSSPTGAADDGSCSQGVSSDATFPLADQQSVSSRGLNKDFQQDSDGGAGWMTFSMILGVVLGIALFIVAPAWLTNLVVGDYDTAPVAWNIVDGVLRVAIFVFYLWLIGRMSDIKRMFSYHGAEHKTIHCFEHGLELTPENARRFPRLHVRCGTAFLIMVLIIAIIVYTIIPVKALIAATGIESSAVKLALVIAIRILFLPLIAGISYEITVKWAGSHPENLLVKVVLWPGMQMQYLTTNEPDDEQLECAIAAMKRVLDRETKEEAAKAGLT